ncbi:MAG: HEAT repeat domain-containing protein [Deltaproteobacteria bacterium]|nr:HEAT repeat domain-containing protein [Deltaproteobacteria bacterium]
MNANDLSVLTEEWSQWCVTADRSEPGWESDFPKWHALIGAARLAMTHGDLSIETVTALATCWAASHETEELLSFATENLDDCWPAIQQLSRATSPNCRWQIYAAASGAGSRAESLLRRGLMDEDPYARRRALLSLAAIRPSDAQLLAERYVNDPEPYMRQAAIEMIAASPDETYRRNALDALRGDPVEHVRAAAEVAWNRLISDRAEGDDGRRPEARDHRSR